MAMSELDAFRTLINSDRFNEECEDANYHSLVDFLRECLQEREHKRSSPVHE